LKRQTGALSNIAVRMIVTQIKDIMLVSQDRKASDFLKAGINETSGPWW
jgi:hypothetical protein